LHRSSDTSTSARQLWLPSGWDESSVAGVVSGGHRRLALRGRRIESDALDRLLGSVRHGRSGVLVLRGESGVGKTALLELLVARAASFRIARATGVESEMELAFAGLHQLCASLLNRLEHLPVPQRNAARIAFGLDVGDAPDRFLVGLAVLSLLSAVAEEHALVCIVDDAQWLDRVSAQCLAFVARRLWAERVALVFAVREPSEVPELSGLPELVVRGLGDRDARALLESVLPGRLDERVRDRIVAETHGNPLALLELPRGLTPAQLAGGFGLAGVMPLAGRIEQSFVRRVRALPAKTQRLLLAAAVEPIGDVTLLWRAAERLGIGTDAVTLAEQAGLIEFGPRVTFRHPLVRSAACGAACLRDLQEVHAALAEAIDPKIDPDRRAWHRAHAGTGPDESVAVELERSAARVLARGGAAAAAAFLERATALTPDPARRAGRALAAAQAKLEAAAPEAAAELLAVAAIGPLDDLQFARVERLRAQVRFAEKRGSDAPPLLLHAAMRLGPLDADLAREAYLEALAAAIFAGRLGPGGGLRQVAEAARVAPPRSKPPRAMDLLLEGLTTRFTRGYAAAVVSLSRALDAFARDGVGGTEQMRWLWLACRVAAELWDDQAWHELAERAVGLARDAGALTILPIALTYRAGVHVHAGEFDAAQALIEESQAIIEATGEPPLLYTSLVLSAWRGREAQALQAIETGSRDASARGEGRVLALAECFTAVLYNGLGRYHDALTAAQRACEFDDLGLHGWALIELIEAAARTDAREVASDALRRLEKRTRASGTDWALGIQARSEALVNQDPDAEAYYLKAIERLARCRIAVHLARARLIYGEWLRRSDRRVDARQQLRTAYDAFESFGAQAFAERARRELLATGEQVRPHTPEARDELTAQEALIAQLARDGQTNPEIAGQLFLSPRTVEYHLGKVFAKLNISSRRELRAVLPERSGRRSRGS
jgi:DNA-binding NarL/FixJ family response regulator